MMLSISFDLRFYAIRDVAGIPRTAATLRVKSARVTKGDLFYGELFYIITPGRGGGNGKPPCLFVN